MVETRQIPSTSHHMLLSVAESLQQLAHHMLTSQRLVQLVEDFYWVLMEGDYRGDRSPEANQLRETLADIATQWESLLGNLHEQSNGNAPLNPEFPPEWIHHWLEQIQSTENRTMPETPKNQPAFHIQQVGTINTGDVTIHGDQVGIQHNYSTNPELAEALAEFKQTIVDLEEKYPQAAEAEIPAIVDVEFQEIKRSQPQRWQNFLNLKRQWNGVKKGLLKVGEHFAEETPCGKGVINYLEGVTDKVE